MWHCLRTKTSGLTACLMAACFFSEVAQATEELVVEVASCSGGGPVDRAVLRRMVAWRKGDLYLAETWCELSLEVKNVMSGKMPTAWPNALRVVVLNGANLAFHSVNQNQAWPY